MKFQLNLNLGLYTNILIDLDNCDQDEIEQKIRQALMIIDSKARIEAEHKELKEQQELHTRLNFLLSNCEYDSIKLMSHLQIKDMIELIDFDNESIKDLIKILEAKPRKAGIK